MPLRLQPRAVVGAAVQALLREQIDARLDQVEGARGPVQLRAVDDRGGPVGDGDEKRTASAQGSASKGRVYQPRGIHSEMTVSLRHASRPQLARSRRRRRRRRRRRVGGLQRAPAALRRPSQEPMRAGRTGATRARWTGATRARRRARRPACSTGRSRSESQPSPAAAGSTTVKAVVALTTAARSSAGSFTGSVASRPTTIRDGTPGVGIRRALSPRSATGLGPRARCRRRAGGWSSPTWRRSATARSSSRAGSTGR